MVRFRDAARPLDGTLLALDDGFVAVVSGKNNLVNAATDFVVLRPAALAAGHAAAEFSGSELAPISIESDTPPLRSFL